MNKFVRERYPIADLPADLREGLDTSKDAEVTVVEIDDPPKRAWTLEELRTLIDTIPPTDDDPVERIRKLRDEWDD